MGQTCSNCGCDPKNKPSPDVIDPKQRPKKLSNTSDASSNDDSDLSDPPSDDEEYSDNDIEVAYDGWKKAIESGNDSLANFHFDEYPAINMFDYKWTNGDTALHIACKNKQPRLVFFLLTKGINVNEQNFKNRCTPLHYAVQKRHEKIIKLLLQWDADPDIENKQNKSSTYIASQYKDKTIYNWFKPNNLNTNSYQPNMNKMKSNADAMNDILDILGSSPGSTKKPSGNKLALSSQESLKELKKIKLGRSAAFTPGLPRMNTTVAVEKIKDNLNHKPLPKLQTWLKKQKPGSGIKKYQKRWCIVKGAHFLWSAKQRTIKNDADRRQRKKFNGFIHFMTMQVVMPYDSHSGNKFIIKAKDAKNNGVMREYIFKTTNKKERDYWVAGLREHKKQYQEILHYLGK